MKFGVIVFPGSNCDHDAYHALKHELGQDTVFLWHKDRDLQEVDVVVVPGGFSYGDYLRSGAIARFSPIMEAVRRHAEADRLVVGICNGFQILQEAGLLPGALLRNSVLKFVCKQVLIRTENTSTPFSSACQPQQILRIPVAHNDGSFFVSDSELEKLKANKQVIFRYVSESGQADGTGNPNGSVDNIAGITNRQGNVLGMMPHPERAAENILGSADGRLIFESIIGSREAVEVR